MLLIAHQKSAIDIKDSSGKHHSLSEAAENPNDWIKTGYINALEYQKPRIQGMIKNNLRDIKMKFATITGSDCHVWSAYPNKDNNVKVFKDYLTKVKCLPTFKGLVLALSSPATRFERKDEGNASNYINQIKLGEDSFELSTGINAIIGENGSGKSYILGKINGENEKIYKKINDSNEIKISKIGEPSLLKISQGEIIEQVKSGNLLENNSEYYDEIPTINEFKNNMTAFVNNLKNYVEEKIRLKANVQKFITEYTKEETRIKDENGTDEIGTTPGEIALTYYKLQLSKENTNDVILIDQLEDDISMKRIENYLIEYFNSVRDKKQVIFVTHNPLLVVNLDVDNVINIDKDRKNIIKINSGCLEDEDILDIVS